MLLQATNSITEGGAVSADYTLTIAFAIIGFLIVAIVGLVGRYFISALQSIKDEIKESHVRIDKRKDDHDELQNSFIKKQHEDDIRLRALEAIDHRRMAEQTADLIMTKLRAITPPISKKVGS